MTMVILGVILWVGLVILMTEMILGGNFHEKRCCEWSDMHSGTPDWFWDIIIVILGGGGGGFLKVILGVTLRIVLVILVTERPRG